MLIKFNDDSEVENRLLKLFESLEGDKEKSFKIMEILEHILSLNWNPTPPNAKPLKWEEDLCELRIKFWNLLYRIHYFVDFERDFMIILNWYTKPDWRSSSNNYNKSKKKKLEQYIQKQKKEAMYLKEQYFFNKWNYELFN